MGAAGHARLIREPENAVAMDEVLQRDGMTLITGTTASSAPGPLQYEAGLVHRIVGPLPDCGDELVSCPPGSWGRAEAGRLTRSGGGWRAPVQARGVTTRPGGRAPVQQSRRDSR